MSRPVIFKYRLEGKGITMIPTRGRVISAGLDPQGFMCVWAEHFNGESGAQQVHAIYTGDQQPEGRFIGTMVVQSEALVYHVYAEI